MSKYPSFFVFIYNVFAHILPAHPKPAYVNCVTISPDNTMNADGSEGLDLTTLTAIIPMYLPNRFKG